MLKNEDSHYEGEESKQLQEIKKVLSAAQEEKEKRLLEEAEAKQKTNEPDLLIKNLASYEIIPETHDHRINRLKDGRTFYNPSVHRSREHGEGDDYHMDIQLIDFAFESYRVIYEVNPVGEANEEIAVQLLGINEHKMVFIAPDSPVFKDNLLLDRWGTPYKFHPISPKDMEIRSAGPDGEFWTDDDIFQESPLAEQLKLN